MASFKLGFEGELHLDLNFIFNRAGDRGAAHSNVPQQLVSLWLLPVQPAPAAASNVRANPGSLWSLVSLLPINPFRYQRKRAMREYRDMNPKSEDEKRARLDDNEGRNEKDSTMEMEDESLLRSTGERSS